MSLDAFYDYVYKEKARIPELVKSSIDKIVNGIE